MKLRRRSIRESVIPIPAGIFQFGAGDEGVNLGGIARGQHRDGGLGPGCIRTDCDNEQREGHPDYGERHLMDHSQLFRQ